MIRLVGGWWSGRDPDSVGKGRVLEDRIKWIIQILLSS